MPVSYRISVDRGYVHVTATGVIELAEMIRSLAELRADPRFQSNFRCLTDCTGVLEIKVPPVGSTQAAKFALFDRAARRAFVARNPKLLGPLVHYINELKPGTVELFSDVASAIAFLNEGYPTDQHFAMAG